MYLLHLIKSKTYGLLGKLLNKGVPCEVQRALESWFGKTQVCVRLNDCYFDYTEINSDIKQSGLMSPILYNVYVDELMKILMKSDLGSKS